MLRIFAVFIFLLPCLSLGQEIQPRNLSEDAGRILAPIPVQNAGRPKPLDSFARFNLLAFYHKAKTEKQSAVDWLAQLLLDPNTAYEVKCFRIKNEDLIADLGLTPSPDHKHFYSFNDLRKIIDAQQERVRAIANKKKDERTIIESQLLNLNDAVHTYFSISRSFTCFSPELMVTNERLAKQLDLPLNKPFSFFYMHQRWEKLRSEIEEVTASPDQAKDYRNSIFSLASRLKDMQNRESAFASLAIIPAFNDPIHSEWKTPWQVLAPQYKTSKEEIAFLTELEASVSALISNQGEIAQKHINILIAASDPKIQRTAKAEVIYNRADFFTNSVVFYILGFLFLCISWLFAGKKLRWASWGCALIGCIIHTVGILLRMYIRGRPAPVTNIYESIIFVGFICVLLGLIIEWKRRDGLGLIISLIPGIILHFVGFKYALDGDTMGRLVAVLDSNFWLSTHVVTIAIGYGAAAIAGLIATAYLYVRLFKPSNKDLLRSISKNFIGISLLALLFSIVGTILGGIWGDQSWGRFWGWDPKENGALLICLWLLVVLHGKWGKQLKELGIATMLSLTNITVLLAWFGVNLLSVGLHNYGFTEGAAKNLTIACGAIFLITIIPTIIIFFRDACHPNSSNTPTS